MSLAKHLNPVWSGYCADPFVLKHDDVYYCYGTDNGSHSTHMEGRKFVLLRSTDLVNWEFLGGALVPAIGNENAAHWAPEVAFAQEKFWMYYSASQSGDDGDQHLRVAVADSAEGPFEDQGTILPDEGFCIDPSPFQDPISGKWFLYFAKDFFEDRVGTGTSVVELADDMRSAVGEPQAVVVAHADWQIYERNRFHYEKTWDSWHTVEGPFVVYKDGRYFCLFSGGNWQNESYGVGYAVADSPQGPWELPVEGASVLTGRPDVIGPGHNSVVMSPDGETHVCVYHAWNQERTERQLCIDAIEWTANGPTVTPTRSAQ
jgi:arabinan endo-1,5-alpha-L-arabinosidase